MSRPSHDPSVENEPHFQFVPARSSETRDPDLDPPPLHPDEAVEGTVWDEPALSAELAGAPAPDDLTWARWLRTRSAETTVAWSWCVTVLVALAAGPWAVAGAMTLGGQSLVATVAAVLFAPLIEETLKISAALWVVEKRPFLFRSASQIALCGLASGAVFAALENVLYLHVYLEDPSPEVIRWRWTVCVALHTTCSVIASVGLIRIWRHTMTRHTRPEAGRGAPWLIAAMVLHGAYNAVAVYLEYIEFQF